VQCLGEPADGDGRSRTTGVAPRAPAGREYLKRSPTGSVKGEPRPSQGRTIRDVELFQQDSKLIPSGLLGPVRLMAYDWSSRRQILSPLPRTRSSPTSRISRRRSSQRCRSKAACAWHRRRRRESFTGGGGGAEPTALFNGTTKNGEGGAETRDDGKTFRGYGKGSSLTIRLGHRGVRRRLRSDEIRPSRAMPMRERGRVMRCWSRRRRRRTAFRS